jgi:hypothetical protein
MALNKLDLDMLQTELQRLVLFLREPVISIRDSEAEESEKSISKYSIKPRKIKLNFMPSTQITINVRKEIMSARSPVS